MADTDFDDLPEEKGKRDGRTEEEWQLIEEHTKNDPDFLLESEKKALEALKSQYPDITSNVLFNDKILLVFLFTRKLDLARTAELLEGHVKYRQANNLSTPLTLDDVDAKLVHSGYSYVDPSGRDKQGRGVMYIRMNLYFPGDYATNSLVKHSVWAFQHLCKTVPLDVHRKGFTVVESISGISIRKNIAFGESKKCADKFMKEGLQFFPMRIASILVVEPGRIINALLGMAKFFVKKKVLQRVECVSKEQILERFDPALLVTEFGGSKVFDYHAYIAQQKEAEVDMVLAPG